MILSRSDGERDALGAVHLQPYVAGPPLSDGPREREAALAHAATWELVECPARRLETRRLRRCDEVPRRLAKASHRASPYRRRGPWDFGSLGDVGGEGRRGRWGTPTMALEPKGFAGGEQVGGRSSQGVLAQRRILATRLPARLRASRQLSPTND